MRRRDFCGAMGLVTAASLLPATCPGTSAGAEAGSDAASSGGPAALKPPTKKMLFFDLWKLDYWDSVELCQGTPELVAEATYTDETLPNKGAGKPCVFHDAQAGVWRMLYNLGWSPIRLMAVASEDGIHWQTDPHPEIEIPADVPGGKLLAAEGRQADRPGPI